VEAKVPFWGLPVVSQLFLQFSQCLIALVCTQIPLDMVGLRDNMSSVMSPDVLLKLLEADARLSDQQIADRLGVRASEVASQRAALEKEGRIIGYQTIVNEDDKGVSAFIEVRCSPERGGGFDRLATRISRFDEVKSCFLISGGFDLLVLVEAQDLMSVARFVSEKLSSMDGVLSTATHFRLKTYKNNGLLFTQEPSHERLTVIP